MSNKQGGASAYGPNPWLQTSWDWRAAGNFICGGAGTGLLMARALFGGPTQASLWRPDWIVFIGLALVGLGLLCVWLEIGRPLRAINVFFNPQTSWMSREAFVGLLLFPAGLAAMLGVPGWNWVTAALALVFLYCQSRMLPAARGIPAWRSGLFSPLFLLTAGCEGLGIFMLLGLFFTRVSGAALFSLLALLLLRLMVWRRYRSGVEASLVARAQRTGSGRAHLAAGRQPAARRPAHRRLAARWSCRLNPSGAGRRLRRGHGCQPQVHAGDACQLQPGFCSFQDAGAWCKNPLRTWKLRKSQCHPGVAVCHPGLAICHPGLDPGSSATRTLDCGSSPQ